MDLDELVGDLERQADTAEAMNATAPVAAVIRHLIPKIQELTIEPSNSGDRPDVMLRAAEVAQRLGISRRTAYKSADYWPFTRRYPSGSVRFSERGMERWLARR
jgi:predicted DNA-binding transcriptional regulator AlpA